MEKETIYKLYKDIEIKPTKDLYLEPSFVGTLLGFGTVLSMNSEVEKIVPIILAGGTIYLFSKGFKEKNNYKKNTQRYEETSKMLEKLTKIINNKIDCDVDLDKTNIKVMNKYENSEDSIFRADIVFYNGYSIHENYVDDCYDCYFSKKVNDIVEKYDLTSEVLSIIKRKK